MGSRPIGGVLKFKLQIFSWDNLARSAYLLLWQVPSKTERVATSTTKSVQPPFQPLSVSGWTLILFLLGDLPDCELAKDEESHYSLLIAQSCNQAEELTKHALPILPSMHWNDFNAWCLKTLYCFVHTHCTYIMSSSLWLWLLQWSAKWKVKP